MTTTIAPARPLATFRSNTGRRLLLLLSALTLLSAIGVVRGSPPAEAAPVAGVKTVAGAENDDVNDVASDPSGNTVAGGIFRGAATFKGNNQQTLNGPGTEGEGFVAKYDHAGDVVWARMLAGTHLEVVDAVATDAQGNIYAAGRTTSDQLLYAGGSIATGCTNQQSNGFVTKLDPNGTILWVRMLGGTDIQRIRSLAVSADRVYFAGSNFGSSTITLSSPSKTLTVNGFGASNQDNAVIGALDLAGLPLWMQLHGSATLSDQMTDVVADASGVYFAGVWLGTGGTTIGGVDLVGLGVEHGFIGRFGKDGQTVWVKASDRPMYTVMLTGDRVVTSGLYAQGRDATTGALQWNLDMPGIVVAGETGPLGQPVLTGYFDGQSDMDMVVGNPKVLNSAGQNDVFVASIDPATGKAFAVEQGGGTMDDRSEGLAVDAAGTVTVSGYFFGTASFSGASATSAGKEDGFLARYHFGPAFHGITPTRMLDTRDGTGGPATKFGPGETRNVKVAGLSADVPFQASGVLVNLTAVNATTDSHLRAWAAGQTMPLASTVNFPQGKATPVLAFVQVGASGNISIYNSAGNVDVVADVVGWFDRDASGSRFVGLQPKRILDTRDAGQTKFGPAETRQLVLGGTVPPDAESVALNVTVADATASSHLTVWPSGVAKPLASNLNFEPGPPVPNMVVTKDVANKIQLFNNSGNVHVIVDVVGYYTATPSLGQAIGVAPTRVLDTRFGQGGPATKVAAGETRELKVGGTATVPGIAKAVVLNVTVADPTETSHLTVWPADQTLPVASNLNFKAGQSVANLVMVKVDANGKVKFRNNSGNVNVIADVVAWYG